MVLMNVSVGRSAPIFRVTEQNLLIHLRRKKPNALRDVKTWKFVKRVLVLCYNIFQQKF